MHVVVVGAGPAGLMAADVISAAGVRVTIVERMPSVGRKLLMAGRGGLNLTHSEPLDRFLGRYGSAREFVAGPIRDFSPAMLRDFAESLGEETFVGSSGRVFPRKMKASPLLRAWLARLGHQGVSIRTRSEVVGIDGGLCLSVRGADGEVQAIAADAVVLALGGGSWSRLGSDGAWTGWLRVPGVEVRPLGASNVGVAIPWSDHFRSRFAGAPVKRVALSVAGFRARGELVVTRAGLEGGVIYAATPHVREALAGDGCSLQLDLRPDMDLAEIERRLSRPRGKLSASAWLRKALRLAPVDIGLLREMGGKDLPATAAALAALVKGGTLDVTGLGGVERAISTAGGVALDGVGPDMMLKALPGVFVAGEMLDWEAPTGGYLLQACFATGYAAGHGALRYLGVLPSDPAGRATPSGSHRAEA